MKFTCPSCSAQVEKKEAEQPGCPCCGFGKQAKQHSHEQGRCQHCHLEFTQCRGHVLCG